MAALPTPLLPKDENILAGLQFGGQEKHVPGGLEDKRTRIEASLFKSGFRIRMQLLLERGHKFGAASSISGSRDFLVTFGCAAACWFLSWAVDAKAEHFPPSHPGREEPLTTRTVGDSPCRSGRLPETSLPGMCGAESGIGVARELPEVTRWFQRASSHAARRLRSWRIVGVRSVRCNHGPQVRPC